MEKHDIMSATDTPPVFACVTRPPCLKLPPPLTVPNADESRPVHRYLGLILFAERKEDQAD